MPEGFIVVCIPCKALYKCYAIPAFTPQPQSITPYSIPMVDGQAEFSWVAGYIPK